MVQLSDIRAEAGGMFRPDLMERVVEEANDEAPDPVAVAGDLIDAGYREQFVMAKGYLNRLEYEGGRRYSSGGVHNRTLLAPRRVILDHFAQDRGGDVGGYGAPLERVDVHLVVS